MWEYRSTMNTLENNTILILASRRSSVAWCTEELGVSVQNIPTVPAVSKLSVVSTAERFEDRPIPRCFGGASIHSCMQQVQKPSMIFVPLVHIVASRSHRFVVITVLSRATHQPTLRCTGASPLGAGGDPCPLDNNNELTKSSWALSQCPHLCICYASDQHRCRLPGALIFFPRRRISHSRIVCVNHLPWCDRSGGERTAAPGPGDFGRKYRFPLIDAEGVRRPASRR